MRAAHLLLAFALPAAALAADAPRIRVELAQPGPVYVGQSLRVDVTVLVPNYFMSSPQFPLFDLPGAVVTMPSEGAVNVSEVVGGTTYAGIKRSYTIVPQQEGEFVLPPAKISFRYAAVPGQASDGSVDLPPEKFEARLPAGAKTAQGALPVARITIRQKVDGLDPPTHVGDAITRTVETFAEHTQSMMIPPPTFTAPEGVKVYRKDPRLTDEKDVRGEFLGGRRVDSATYLFERPGDFELPEISVPWFDSAKNRAEAAIAPKIQVKVVASPDAKVAIAPEPPPPPPPTPEKRFDWRRWGLLVAAALAGLLVLLVLTRLWRRRVLPYLAARRVARHESESAYFSRLLAACRSNDPSRAYAELGRWVRRAGMASVEDCVAADASGALRAPVGELEECLYSGAGRRDGWKGATLATALERSRRTSTDRRVRSPARHGLPNLNP